MTTKERLHTLIEEMPEERLSKMEHVLEELAKGVDLTVVDEAGRALFAAGVPSPAPTTEERLRILQNLQDRFGHRLPSHEEYLADKEREKARDEERLARLAERLG